MPYATCLALVDRYPATANLDAAQMTAELTAASAFIDGYCHRTFDLEAPATVRYFPAPPDRVVLDLGPFEIGTTEGVIVATDDGSNTYSTTVTDYQLEPVNALYASPYARPYTSIRRIGAYWPHAASTNARQERVKVTARYGWPAVPGSVVQACMTLANNAFENPDGVKSEAIDGYSVTYQGAEGQIVGVPPSVLAQLGPLRRGWAA